MIVFDIFLKNVQNYVIFVEKNKPTFIFHRIYKMIKALIELGTSHHFHFNSNTINIFNKI